MKHLSIPYLLRLIACSTTRSTGRPRAPLSTVITLKLVQSMHRSATFVVARSGPRGRTHKSLHRLKSVRHSSAIRWFLVITNDWARKMKCGLKDYKLPAPIRKKAYFSGTNSSLPLIPYRPRLNRKPRLGPLHVQTKPPQHPP